MRKMATDDWKNPTIRQNFIDTIEEAIRQWGNPTTRTASEMEIYSFERASTKEDYLNYHVWLMTHIQGLSTEPKTKVTPRADVAESQTIAQTSDPQEEEDWKSSEFRQNVIAKIEGAMWISGNPTTKSACEMENHFFDKSNNKEEYLNHLSRLLVHIKQLSAQFQAFKNRAQGMSSGVGAAQPQANVKPKVPPQQGTKEKARGSPGVVLAVSVPQPPPKNQEQDDEWKTFRFRQNVITKIGEVIRQSGNPTSKSASDMEFHFFQRSNNKEEYLQYLARLLVHIKGLTNVVMDSH
ncbi:mediator of RNA polymerase II transcription subunit 15-like isoform X1 [Daphnia pulex]|uniref:mediator of RNA polymerase II transcription subunit 15-like isoform X1 n=1 Tax=Daphnia pulex TaxID=6669 RepID=UPI001EDD619A|nr:mediator of RNA polymerase II transcription subunit 15-like isoform X1 [Daphnia pulex]